MALQDYPTTQWTLVLQAADANDPVRARQALQRLCVHYHDAILGHMRRAGLNHEAGDAANEFIHGWLARNESPLINFQRRETLFRKFLAVCLDHFVKDWHKTAPPHEPLDSLAESLPDPKRPAPDPLELDFAHSVARAALVRLRESWQGSSRAAAFLPVARIVFLEDETPYADIARQHGCKVNTVKGWVLSMRQEYGDCFRQEIARITTPAEAADEWRYLMELAPYERDGTSFYATLTGIFR